MQIPSITAIITTIFLIYIIHSMWTLMSLFATLKCSGKPCYKSYLEPQPKLQLILFQSTHPKPISNEVQKITTISNFNYNEELHRELDITIPSKTRKNGTLYLHVVLAHDNIAIDWNEYQRDGPTVIQRIALTEYISPKATTYNLLSETEKPVKKKNKQSLPSEQSAPVAHFKPKVYISVLTDNCSMSQADIPPEIANLLRVNRKNEFLPIIMNNFLKTRMADLTEITMNSTTLKLDFFYAPITIGRLRLLLHVEHGLRSLLQLGFTRKDIDEVKGIFSDTNVYLLCGTVFVGSIHVLFDFLSFKNDVSFWRRKKNYAGLSQRTTLWRGFSQIIIFLYLFDENTSLLVLIPCGIGMLIDLWKCKKILKLDITLRGGFSIRKTVNENERIAKAEKQTGEFDKEAMKYLSYLLYPLCLAGAVYSLVYEPHKSWYSWTINSMVNGVYAFGFLFMLPQLFVNYKLKSVAALPWRAFMYKAFNTFIDDIFAFIITMPTAHRIACFRDDIVFIIYLYQRWLYPVDKSRIDENTSMDDAVCEQEPLVDDSKTTAIEDKKTN